MKIRYLYWVLCLLLTTVYADNVGTNSTLSMPLQVQAGRNSGNQFTYGSNGQAIGNIKPLGSQTNFYSNNGQYIGKAQSTPNGSTYYYNSAGQITGYSLNPNLK